MLVNVAAAFSIEHTPMELSVPMLRGSQIPAEGAPRAGLQPVFWPKQVRSHGVEMRNRCSPRSLKLTRGNSRS
jgi:hypothetical protein